MEHRLNEMQTDVLWNKAREAGMSRRKFLALLASSGAAAVLAACAPKAVTTPTPTPTSTPKPTPAPTSTPVATPKTATPTAQAPITIVHMSLYGKMASRTNYAFDDPLMDKLEERSNGRIKFKRYYEAELVSQSGALDACAKGTIDWFQTSGTYYESVVPEGDYALTFFNYPSMASAVLFLDLPEVKKIYQDAYAKAGVFCLGPMSHDHQTIFTKVPINKIADLKGMKLRGAGGNSNKGLEVLGVAPVMVTTPELYTALQRGTVDGAIHAEYYFYNAKFYEIIKYMTLPPFIPVQGMMQLINPKKWQELGPELQKLVEDTFREQHFWWVAQSYREDEQIRLLIKGKGVTYTELPPEDFAKAKALVEPLKDEWGKRSPGCARLLELERAWEKLDYKVWKL